MEREQILALPFMALWTALAFQAGFINSYGFLACGRYVSHVTGFGTQVGIAMGEGQWAFAIEMLGTPLSFILGSFASSLLTAVRKDSGKSPRYDLISFTLPVILFLISIIGRAGGFGPYGEDLLHLHDFALLFSLSFACGIQNGCFATLTKGQVRTTHLTGISTDLGTDLARYWYGDLPAQEKKWIKRNNFCRTFILVGFATGSILSAILSRKFEYLSLLAPLATSLGVFLTIKFLSEQQRRQTGENSLPSATWTPG